MELQIEKYHLAITTRTFFFTFCCAI